MANVTIAVPTNTEVVEVATVTADIDDYGDELTALVAGNPNAPKGNVIGFVNSGTVTMAYNEDEYVGEKDAVERAWREER